MYCVLRHLRRVRRKEEGKCLILILLETAPLTQTVLRFNLFYEDIYFDVQNVILVDTISPFFNSFKSLCQAAVPFPMQAQPKEIATHAPFSVSRDAHDDF